MYSKSMFGLDLGACAQLCLTQTTFDCASFDYSFGDRSCQMSRYIASNVGGIDTDNMPTYRVMHYEKKGESMSPISSCVNLYVYGIGEFLSLVFTSLSLSLSSSPLSTCIYNYPLPLYIFLLFPSLILFHILIFITNNHCSGCLKKCTKLKCRRSKLNRNHLQTKKPRGIAIEIVKCLTKKN